MSGKTKITRKTKNNNNNERTFLNQISKIKIVIKGKVTSKSKLIVKVN